MPLSWNGQQTAANTYWCPNCNSTVYHGYKACGNCGIPLDWGTEKESARSTSNYWCPNCNATVFQGNKACNNCGIPLDWGLEKEPARATNAYWCPSCNATVFQSKKACNNCGIPLDWGTEKELVRTATGKAAGKKPLKALSWVATAALVVVVGFLGFIYLSPDYDMYLVKSESMVPAINMGDMIITGPVSYSSLQPGKVVTYKLGKELVTHRVLSINGDTLITKGDAVEGPDPSPIARSQLQGQYLFKIPALGFVASFMGTKFGWFLVVIVPAILLLGLIFWEIAKEILKMSPKRLYINDMNT
jgi:signal peptidase